MSVQEFFDYGTYKTTAPAIATDRRCETLRNDCKTSRVGVGGVGMLPALYLLLHITNLIRFISSFGPRGLLAKINQ